MNARKILAVVTLVMCSSAVFAQQNTDEITFKPHATLSLQGGISHTLGEASFSDLLSPAAQVTLGYHFTPVLGMRIGAQGWQAKGGWPARQAKYKFNQLSGNVDFLFNLSNLIGGFNPKRTLSLSAFVGAGLNHAWDNDEANAIDYGTYKMEYLWSGSKNSIQGRGGLILDIRLSDVVSFNVEANANMLTDKFNSKKAGNADWYFNGLVGLTFRLGKSYKVTPAYVPAPVVEEPAPAPVVEQKKEEPKPVVVEKKREPFKCDVFFTISKTVPVDAEIAKIDQLGQYLVKYPDAKVVLSGYADKGTGNARINEALSKGRVYYVADRLAQKYNIDRNRMTVDYKGDTVQPFAENDMNRVTICVTD